MSDVEARVEQVLVPHPTANDLGVERVAVQLEVLSPGWLECTYRIDGGSAKLKIPAADDMLDAQRLWEHTCCEVFVAAADGTAYEEWNISPTGQHANFEFDDYRARRAEPQRLPSKVKIDVDVDGTSMVLKASIPVRSADPQPPLLVGVAVVLEAEDGTLSHWAIRHPAAEPDFHHRDGFALRLNLDPQPRFEH